MNSAEEKKSFSELINGDVPVLIDFYGDWCAPCRIMSPILKELKSEMGDAITVIKIDTERNPEVAIRYQVRGVPNLVLVHKGKVIWQQAGVVPMSRLKTLIEEKLEHI